MSIFENSLPSPSYSGNNTGTGYLIVRVSTARNAIPLENAVVQIRSAGEELAAPPVSTPPEPGTPLPETPVPDGSTEHEPVGRGNLIASARTGRDGLTMRFALPAPARRESESPGFPSPYSVFDMEVSLEGYQTQFYQNVVIFDTITSLQSVELIPLSEGKLPQNSYQPESDIFRGEQNPML